MATQQPDQNQGSRFRIPARRQRGECRQCGQQGRLGNSEDGAHKEGLCEECRLYIDQPEMGYHWWTWRLRTENQWQVTCKIRHRDDVPQTGQQVTVHRRNGTTSVETLKGEGHVSLSRAAVWIVVFDVE